MAYCLAYTKRSPPNEEEVASVDGDSISEKSGWRKWKRKYGNETLLGIVNAKVMEAAAKKYNIKVSDQEIDS